MSVKLVVGITGYIGMGKNTAGEMLARHFRDIHGLETTLLSFAEPLKDAVSEIFGFDRAMLEGDTPEGREDRERVDYEWCQALGEPITGRIALQRVGMGLRDCFHDPNIWVEAARRRILEQQTADVAIFTDLRFRNEEAMIRNMGGKILRVHRLALGRDSLEPTEKEIPLIGHDYIICTDGKNSLPEVEMRVRQLAYDLIQEPKVRAAVFGDGS